MLWAPTFRLFNYKPYSRLISIKNLRQSFCSIEKYSCCLKNISFSLCGWTVNHVGRGTIQADPTMRVGNITCYVKPLFPSPVGLNTISLISDIHPSTWWEASPPHRVWARSAMVPVERLKYHTYQHGIIANISVFGPFYLSPEPKDRHLSRIPNRPHSHADILTCGCAAPPLTTTRLDSNKRSATLALR